MVKTNKHINHVQLPLETPQIVAEFNNKKLSMKKVY
jgi:hypothetical protein